MKKCTGKGGKSLGCPEVVGDNTNNGGQTPTTAYDFIGRNLGFLSTT